MAAPDLSARDLARAWTASVETTLGGLRTEISQLHYALSAQPSAHDAADDEVVALTRTLCASAAELGARYDSLSAFVVEAPPLAELLSVAEAKLDAADAALDATEAAIGLPPVVVAEAPSPPPPADGLLEGVCAASLSSRARARAVPLSRAPVRAAAPLTTAPAMAARLPSAMPRSYVATPVRARPYVPATPPRPPLKEASLPNTPTLADFGISNDALAGIYKPVAPKFPLPTDSVSPSVTASRASPLSRGGGGGGSAWARADAEASLAHTAFEDSSPVQEEEGDPGDETYDEQIGRYMQRLGIEPADVLRTRYGRTAGKNASPTMPSPPQLRGLDGHPLYSEETPRVQTRRLRSQAAFTDELGYGESRK